MTEEEKLDAIYLRWPGEDKLKDPNYLSFTVITNYMNILMEHGIIHGEVFQISEKGKDFASVCNEFDWKPSDDMIASFVSQFIRKKDQIKIGRLLMTLRDDGDRFKKFLNILKQSKNK